MELDQGYSMPLASVEYQLPYEEYVPIHEKNENKILDILHRVIACERKRPVLHRTTTINSVRFLLPEPCPTISSI